MFAVKLTARKAAGTLDNRISCCCCCCLVGQLARVPLATCSFSAALLSSLSFGHYCHSVTLFTQRIYASFPVLISSRQCGLLMMMCSRSPLPTPYNSARWWFDTFGVAAAHCRRSFFFFCLSTLCCVSICWLSPIAAIGGVNSITVRCEGN